MGAHWNEPGYYTRNNLPLPSSAEEEAMNRSGSAGGFDARYNNYLRMLSSGPNSAMGGDPNEGLTSLQRNMGMANNMGDISGMLSRGGRNRGFTPRQSAAFYGQGGPGFFDPDKDMDTGDFWSGLGKSMGGGIKSFFGKPLQVVNTALGIGDYFQKNKAMGQYGDYLGMLRGQIGAQKEMSDKTWDAFDTQRKSDIARVAKFDESQALQPV